ncbi:MAG: GGDEF domain-containing protein, partial [Aquificota bacterium]
RVSLIFFLVLVAFLAISMWTLRAYAINIAEREARNTAELVRDTLTSYMILGVMDRRDEFLTRIREIEGIKDIRVIRGPAVVKQFGAGGMYEVPKDEIEKAVLQTGKEYKKLSESFTSVSYRIVLPYKAEPIKGIDCLRCHQANPGETLGAISLTLDLNHYRAVSLKIVIALFTFLLFAIGGTVWYISRFTKSVQAFIEDVVGNLQMLRKGEIKPLFKSETHTEELRKLRASVEDVLNLLSSTLQSIEEKVRAMIGYGVLKTGDILSDTSKIVDELLRIYRFKRVVEKDKSKEEVYRRIVEVLGDYMSLDKFSIYEVGQSGGLKLIHARGNDMWCKDIILENSEECRAKRTGTDVDSREFPCVCPNFVDNESCSLGKIHYYCIPVYVGGSVGNVVQIVYEREMEPFINLLIPYIKGYLNEASPVLEARTYMDMLKEQSVKDSLTGLYNRRFLEEVLPKLTAQVQRRGSTLGILAVDVDYFKQINDTYGHDVGDKVLAEVASLIRRNIREADIAIRYGGEEFLVLLVDVQKGKSTDVAEKIRRAIEEHSIEVNGKVLHKTVSIGVSEFPVDSDKIWQCIKFADVALYKAKEMGRNRVVRFQREFWTQEEY